MEHTLEPYLKAEEQVRATTDRRNKEDLELKTELEREQAKLEHDQAVKLQVHEVDLQSSRRKLEEEEEVKTKALKDRHEE
jgi:hypothetical protein